MSERDYVKMFKQLHKLTQQQDELQLSIPKINESVAISLCLVDHANALILEASEHLGDIRPQVRFGYTLEKVLAIISDWNAMAHDYNISHDDMQVAQFECKMVVKEQSKPPKEIMEQQRKLIFKDQPE